MGQSSSKKDVLYFDGSCPLCAAEIAKLSDAADETLECQDIHAISTYSDIPSKRVLLKRLHLKTANGEWLTGIDANVRAWQHTRYGRFWKILTWPVVRIFSAAFYEVWLRLRPRG